MTFSSEQSKPESYSLANLYIVPSSSKDQVFPQAVEYPHDETYESNGELNNTDL